MNGWPGSLWIDKIFNYGVPSNDSLLWFFRVITQLGSPLAFIILAIISSMGFWLWHQRGAAVFVCTAVTSGWILNHILKDLVMRPRPPVEKLTYAAGYSFPSGHAMVSMAFYGFLAYLALVQGGRWGKAGAATLGLLIFLIGASRIYLHVHYPSDVIAGWLLGFLVVLANIQGLRRWQKNSGN